MGSIQKKNRRPEPEAVPVVAGQDAEDKGIDFVALFRSLAQIYAVMATVIVVLMQWPVCSAMAARTSLACFASNRAWDDMARR